LILNFSLYLESHFLTDGAMMRPTMADVAERAGVSTSTVSLTLNDKPGVSGAVREVVLDAVRELGYRLPRRHHREQPTPSKTFTIVHFAPPEWSGQAGLTGLASVYVSGIQDYCQAHSVNWALIAHYQPGNVDHVGFALLEQQELDFDGLVLITPLSADTEVLQRAIDEQLPVVVISRCWPTLPISCVTQDHWQQARLAVDHLVELGHRKIAFVARESDEPYDWFSIRLDYYQEVMCALGEDDPSLVVVERDVCQGIGDLMSRRPDVTALLAVHDTAAMLAMQGLRQLGLGIPDDVSVIGIGNDVPSMEGYPALTTVGFPAHKVGVLAAKTLLDHIEDPELAYSRTFVQSWIVTGESCAPPHL
jgi:LacI family transcriptional regulator